jgi:beta-ribofuranosylaminobenzene 5'-phosphate synthase
MNKLGIAEPQLLFRIRHSSPPHSGFGWRTQLRIGIAAATSVVLELPIRPLDLGPLMGRGGTSGIGSLGFWHGGLIVDGGHPRSNKPTAHPSAEIKCPALPPLLFNHSFPWGVLVGIAANMEPVSGSLEGSLFRSYTPVPEREALESIRVVHTELASAVAENNFPNFCDSIVALRELGFKRRELEFRGAAGKAAIRRVESTGAKGVSMSSWGPAFFGFFSEVADAQSAADALKVDSLFSAAWATEASPGGAVINYCGQQDRALDLITKLSVH